MANHSFHTWRTLRCEDSSSFAPDSRTLVIPGEMNLSVKDIAPKDLVRVFSEASEEIGSRASRQNVFSVVTVELGASTTFSGDTTFVTDTSIVVTLDSDLPPEFVGNKVSIELKELSRVFKLTRDALSHSSVKSIKAEAYYILGKMYHTQREYSDAFKCYMLALQEEPNMELAAFSAAQIHLSKQNYVNSLEIFEQLLKKHPDDKDTQAFVILLKALHKKEMSPMELVKEVAPGFQFEIDLWLIQGQLRLKTPTEFNAALRCFYSAIECMDQQGVPINPLVLSNISVLQHSLGKLHLALEFGKRALLEVERKTAELNPTKSNPSFKSSDLEGVYYTWSEVTCTVYFDASGKFHLYEGSSDDEVIEFDELFKSGDDILIGDLYHQVLSTDKKSFTAKSPVPLTHSRGLRVQPRDSSAESSDEMIGTSTSEELPSQNGKKSVSFVYEVKRKILGSNFHEASITLNYNFARLLEDTGSTRAAIEVYVELLKQHPSFMECKYLFF